MVAVTTSTFTKGTRQCLRALMFTLYYLTKNHNDLTKTLLPN